MNIRKLSPLFFACMFLLTGFRAHAGDTTETDHGRASAVREKRINLIVSPRINGPDAGTISFQIQAFWQRLAYRSRVRVIVAGSAEEMYRKASRILEREKARIGNLWFDSHGRYGKRYAMFRVGKDEFNWRSLEDTVHVRWLKKLAHFADEKTRVGIGACYAGATFIVPAIGPFPPCPMGGDSLMVRLSRLMHAAEVYGCESWVMSNPGLFGRELGLSGYPRRRIFRDVFLRPAWERVGIWNVYQGKTRRMNKLRGVYLDVEGSIRVSETSYQDIGHNKKKIESRIRKLKKGAFHMSYLYQ